MIYTDANGRPIPESEWRERFNAGFARSFREALQRPEPEWREILTGPADVRLLDGFLWESEASKLFGKILCGTPWRDDTIRAYGRVCRVPRRAQYFGASTVAPYTYSSITMAALPWSVPLARLRDDVQLATGERFNAALVNLYVDGSHCVGWHCVGWHSDDEPGVGDCIASVSLGATRDFRLRRIADASDQRKLALADGSLLVMRGETQRLWQHSLPKRKGVRMPRINVTFRQMVSP